MMDNLDLCIAANSFFANGLFPQTHISGSVFFIISTFFGYFHGKPLPSKNWIA